MSAEYYLKQIEQSLLAYPLESGREHPCESNVEYLIYLFDDHLSLKDIRNFFLEKKEVRAEFLICLARTISYLFNSENTFRKLNFIPKLMSEVYLYCAILLASPSVTDRSSAVDALELLGSNTSSFLLKAFEEKEKWLEEYKQKLIEELRRK